MRRSINWHEECLKNQKISLKKKGEQLKQLQDNYARCLLDSLSYEQQILEAKMRGKDGFDKEKFNKKKRGS